MKTSRVLPVAAFCCLVFAFCAVAQEGTNPAPSARACFADPALCLPAMKPLEAGFQPEKSAAREPAPLRAKMNEPQSSPPAQNTAAKLTVHDAELLALKQHPRITIAQLEALASGQVVREVRAAFFPTLGLSATGVKTYKDGNRITAGLLNNPSVFDRAGSGLSASQLITDFGRTRNLVTASGLSAQAQQQAALATREQIVFVVDQTFYNALSSGVLVKVAEETVQARQVVVDQIQALENAKLRSALDLSFANVSLAQAQLLLVNAKNDRDAAYASLSEALGFSGQQAFELVDTTNIQPPTESVDVIIQEALANRPDVKALDLEQSSAEHLTTAEERLQFPVVSALGATGITPVASNRLGNNGYGAVGANIQIPVFNGFLFSARAAEAKLRAKAAAERVRDLKDTVSRQVRVAWLNMNSALERENVAAQLLQQATQSMNLAQARYNLGLGSIVELSQAQLQQTDAEISTVTAKYQYEFSLSELAYQAGANLR